MAEPSGSNSPSCDELVRQVVSLPSKVAVLESKQRETTFTPPQEPAGGSHGLPHEVEAPIPASFTGACDGDYMKNFVDSVNTYFSLVSMHDGIPKARFASVLLEGKASTWFTVQG